MTGRRHGLAHMTATISGTEPGRVMLVGAPVTLDGRVIGRVDEAAVTTLGDTLVVIRLDAVECEAASPITDDQAYSVALRFTPPEVNR